jgi:hypothetical protein|tara:strand:+ start:327 stop:617 length:291 start_codon:yes stop_codon:yes gene_type:complete
MSRQKRNRKSLFESIFPCWNEESSEEELEESDPEDEEKFGDLDFDREEIQKYRENENFFDQFVISQDSGFIAAWNAGIILLKVGSGLWYLTMACFW